MCCTYSRIILSESFQYELRGRGSLYNLKLQQTSMIFQTKEEFTIASLEHTGTRMLQFFPLLLRLHFSLTDMKHLKLNLTVKNIEILPLLGWQLLASFPRLMTCALTSGTTGVRCCTAHDISGKIST